MDRYDKQSNNVGSNNVVSIDTTMFDSLARALSTFAPYYAFVIVSLAWLAYFLSHDYLSYKNSLGFLFIFCFSLTKGQCSKR